MDEARSFVLTTQFRSPGSLEASAQAIRAGRPISFGERELQLARSIGRWNAAVTLGFLGSAACLGVFIGAVVARSPLWVLAGVGLAAAAGFSGAFALMGRVDRMVRAVRTPEAAGSDEAGDLPPKP